MLLVVDIGNTNITLGLFDKGTYVSEYRLLSNKNCSEHEYSISLSELLKDYNIEACIIASVVNELNTIIKKAVHLSFGISPIFLTYQTNSGVKIVAKHPEEVGADRIANAAAVVDKYDNAIIIVDCGTATTFEIINSKKEFCGGIIAPGLQTQLNSLAVATSKLPQIKVEACPIVSGTNTKEAMLSGVVRGTACMIDGLIDECINEIGEDASIVLTGGFSKLISKYLKHKIEDINPILTLEGLKNCYYREINA